MHKRWGEEVLDEVLDEGDDKINEEKKAYFSGRKNQHLLSIYHVPDLSMCYLTAQDNLED